jgi:ABC-type dipeptide/oligopeptide/nickel transport system permease component
MLKRKLLHHAIALIVVLVLGCFLSVSLVRLAPGHNSDEELLDPHLSSASRQALMQSRHGDQSTSRFFLQSTRNLLHGDLGVSQSLGQPIAQLIRDRAPVTALTGEPRA